MTTVDDLIERLRPYEGDVNPGATTAEIDQLRDLAGGWLPDDLQSIYKDHNGKVAGESQLEGTSLPVRLMPVAEVIREAAGIREYDIDPLPGRILWTWTDDDGNFLGVIADGPLRGMMACVGHDELDLSPCYRNVRSFVLSVLDSVKDDTHRPTNSLLIPSELPTIRDAAATIQADRHLADSYFHDMERLPEGGERTLAAFIALRLLPVADMERVIPILHHTDMWIAERAVELVAYRRWAPGVPELGKVIESGGHNAVTAACLALLRWPECQEVVQEKERLSKTLTGKARTSWDQWTRVEKRSRKHMPWWKFW